jgi:hypothetical protein
MTGTSVALSKTSIWNGACYSLLERLTVSCQRSLDKSAASVTLLACCARSSKGYSEHGRQKNRMASLNVRGRNLLADFSSHSCNYQNFTKYVHSQEAGIMFGLAVHIS